MTCGDAAAADRVLDVPLHAEDIDRRILVDAAVRDVDQAAHAGVARGRTEVLVAGQIDPRRAVRTLTHVVVRGGHDLLDAAAGLGQRTDVTKVDGGDFRVPRKLRQDILPSAERSDARAGGAELPNDDPAQ